MNFCNFLNNFFGKFSKSVPPEINPGYAHADWGYPYLVHPMSIIGNVHFAVQRVYGIFIGQLYQVQIISLDHESL